MTSDRPLVDAVRRALAAAGDPEVAAGQQAYMRSAMPFHGVPRSRLAGELRPLLHGWQPDRATWEGTIRALWDEAERREEWYAALTLARLPLARTWRDASSLGLWRHVVVTGAWWDVVDETAAHLVGGVLAAHRAQATPVVRGWASEQDAWLRRTAVLSQLRHGAETDLDLLRHAVEANVGDRSFWLRKAIGWALRQQARTDPEWVRAEVDRLGDRLSALSRREVLRHRRESGPSAGVRSPNAL